MLVQVLLGLGGPGQAGGMESCQARRASRASLQPWSPASARPCPCRGAQGACLVKVMLRPCCRAPHTCSWARSCAGHVLCAGQDYTARVRAWQRDGPGICRQEAASAKAGTQPGLHAHAAGEGRALHRRRARPRGRPRGWCGACAHVPCSHGCVPCGCRPCAAQATCLCSPCSQAPLWQASRVFPNRQAAASWGSASLWRACL